MTPFISICIPAYKRVVYLKRLLDSLATQTYTNFEVVITDDSTDDSVRDFILPYKEKLNIVYQRNYRQMGTPENWNEAIKLARGEWIKLMHDDDWFLDDAALLRFSVAANQGRKFIFSSYTREYLQTGKTEKVMPDSIELNRVKHQPHVLFAKNIIGPPSVTMVHRSIAEIYDKNLSWLVDIDYYLRVLDKETFHFIPEYLVAIGMSEVQVTSYSFLNPAVEIPESFYLLKRYGLQPLRNIWVYDGWWRLMRNLKIRNFKTLKRYLGDEPCPKIIRRMLMHQRILPLFLLRKGIVSKSVMLLSYLLNKKLVPKAKRKAERPFGVN
jgi:glycosyltransferase involved in cell wall biosynthesis